MRGDEQGYKTGATAKTMGQRRNQHTSFSVIKDLVNDLRSEQVLPSKVDICPEG